MCGRYSLAIDMRGLEDRFAIRDEGLSYQPRFNIAPAQEVLTVTSDGTANRAQLMKWGLVPSWAKDPAMGQRMINARAETVAQRPAFRDALRKRRCIIPADGFYEWMNTPMGRKPMRIILKSGEPFGFAGLWEVWRAPGGGLLRSCTIITTTPNEVLKSIHDRMPVILPREAEAGWLDEGSDDPGVLMRCLGPYPADEMETYEVSTMVNSPRYDIPEVIARIG